MKNLLNVSILFGWLLVFHTDASAQNTSGFGRFGEWIKDDPISLFRNVGPEQLIGIGTAGITIASLSVFDEPSSRRFQQNYARSDFLNFANGFGNKRIILPATAVLFGSSLLTGNTKFQDAAFTSLESVIMTSLTVGTGKFLFARSRPGEDDGAYDFDFISPGETSFPSGHTARAFAFITPWVMYYPNAFTYSLLVIPAGTAVARIAKGKHWMSDVAAGAAIGFSMGYHLSKKHLSAGNEHLRVTPVFGSNFASMSVNVKF